MTKEQTKAAREVMQAFEDGAVIECRSRGLDNHWISTLGPDWNWPDVEYRVKPEPRHLWISQTPTLQIFKSPDTAFAHFAEHGGTPLIHVVEVL